LNLQWVSRSLTTLHWLLGLVLVSLLQIATSPEPYALPAYNHAVLAAFLATFALVLTGAVAFLARFQDPANRVPVWFILWPCATFWIARSLIGIVVPPTGQWISTVLSVVVVGTVVFAAVKRSQLWWIALASLALGVWWRHHYFAVFPIDPARADMLPLVRSALQQLFSGHAPYRVYAMPWPLPLTYLPGTFLPYKLPLMLGLDMRWATVLAQVGCLAAMVWLAARRIGSAWRAAPGFVVWAVVFLSAEQTFFDATNTAPWGGWRLFGWPPR